MFNTVRIIAEDAITALVLPRIEKAKADFKLKILTATVVVVFSLLALVCLFMVVFIHLSQIMMPETAALWLFGFSIFMCLGAIAMYVIGRKVDQKLYERKIDEPSRALHNRMPTADDIDIAGYARDLFADNKSAALIAASVIGIAMGAKPGLVLKGLASVFTGRKQLDRVRRKSRR